MNVLPLIGLLLGMGAAAILFALARRIAHRHKWVKIGEHRAYKHLAPKPGTLPMYITATMQCEGCGDIKRVRI